MDDMQFDIKLQETDTVFSGSPEVSEELRVDFSSDEVFDNPAFDENSAEFPSGFSDLQIVTIGKITVKIQQTSDGAVITVVDDKDTQSATIKNGSRGPRGEPGKDGIPGERGLPGEPGPPGRDGHTPVKGIDYFDGKDGRDGVDGLPGKDGVDGKDGVTPRIGNDGNWFVGDADTGVPATGPQGEKGEPGPAGLDGRSPVRGIDYWTPDDVRVIVDSVVDEVLFIDVEAIVGDAKAYILTNYIPNSRTRVAAKLYFNVTSTTRCVFGARTSTSSNRFDFGNNSSSKYNFGWGAAATASSFGELSDVFDLDVNRNAVYINGEEAVTRADGVWEAQYPMAIFACNTKGTVGNLAPSGTIIQRFKIFEDDVLIHDFVPRKHLVDGYGLYDKIGKKFYKNVSDSGSFTGK